MTSGPKQARETAKAADKKVAAHDRGWRRGGGCYDDWWLRTASSLRKVADELWAHAHKVSDEAGCVYKDRRGQWQQPQGEPPQLVNDVLTLWRQRLDQKQVCQPSTLI